MSIKALSASDFFKQFEKHLSRADIISARLLSKISFAIFKKRIALGLNQKEFAEKLSVSQAMVSKWESENYNYSIESLANISEKLNFDIDIKITDRESTIHYPKSQENTWVMTKNKKVSSPQTHPQLMLSECA